MYNKKTTLSLNSGDIYTDINSITTIIENIYSNALKYSNENIDISFVIEDDSFILSIEDDGIGICDDQKGKIFELFVQNESDVLTRKNEGTGVGLYLVKLLSDEMDYKIEVNRSTLGGAKFSIKGKI